MYAALLLHTYTAFPFFEDSATQREGERGPRGAKFAHICEKAGGEGRDAEKRESPRLIKSSVARFGLFLAQVTLVNSYIYYLSGITDQKPRDNQSRHGARRRWPAGIGRLPFILRESEGRRVTELQATPPSSHLLELGVGSVAVVIL